MLNTLQERFSNSSIWLVGSHLHGLATSESDEDYTGVFFNRDEYLNPLVDRDVTYTFDNNNHTMHSAAKFARLVVKGNPTIVDLLYNAPQVSCSFVDGLIKVMKPHAITQSLIKAYMGYANEQFRRGFKPSTPQNANRKAQTERDGYDAKYVMHLCRLIICGGAILDSGTYQKLNDEDKSRLISIRNAEYPKDAIVTYVTGIMKGFENTYKRKLETLSTGEELKHEIRNYFVKNSPRE